MGFLLVHHELLRAKARVNELTLDQTKFQRKKANIEKAIQKKEEFFNKKSTALKNYWSQQKSALTNSLNMGDFAALGSVLNLPGQLTNASMSLFAGVNSRAAAQIPYDLQTGKFIGENDSQKIQGKDELSQAEMYQAMQAMTINTQQQNMMLSQLRSTYQAMLDQLVQTSLEMGEQQIEDEKDAALLPLKDEDSDMDIKIATNELQLTEAKEYAENLKQEESQRVKDSTPKFGLG